jgi:hypothetical protein
LAAKERHDSRDHFDRALALFDLLLRRSTLVVEGYDTLGRPRQIGRDEPDARIKLAGVPLDLGHDTPRLPPPALRLIAACPVGKTQDLDLSQTAPNRRG